MIKTAITATLLVLGLDCISQLRFKDVSVEQSFIHTLMADTHGSGVAAADSDNDGDIDFYLCTERGFPDLLYQNESSSFTEIGRQVGLGSDLRSRMALWIDVNGDGQLDLLVTGDCDYDEDDCMDSNLTRLYLQKNSQFEEVSDEFGLQNSGPTRNDQALGGMSAADINLDGWIDFVITIRNGPMQVFLNQNGSSFVISTLDLGLDTLDNNYYQPMFYDFDENGMTDLYCNVDFEPNQLWMQETYGQFVNRGRPTRSDSDFNEMGMSLGDFDRDGDMDIYATNIDNFLGQENAHNILLQNNLSLTGFIGFSEVSTDFGVSDGGWGWGTTLFDANNDGWLDIAATNGWDRPFDVIDTSKFWIRNPASNFIDISDSVGFNDNFNATALLSFDYDRDGDLDLIQTLKGFSEPTAILRLLRNDFELENQNYLTVKPRMRGNNKYALGSKVKVYTDDAVLLRYIHAGTSFYGQEPCEAHFGLGSVEEVDVEIEWPGGSKSYWTNVVPNQILEIDDSDVVHTPTGLMGRGLGTNVELFWNDLSFNEESFVLERSLDENFEQITPTILAPNTTEYRDEQLNEGSIYYYRIKARSSNFESSYSNTAEIQTIILSQNIEFKKTNFYPNPVQSEFGYITIKSSQKIQKVSIYDLNGKLKKTVKPDQTNALEFQMDLSHLLDGIYIIKIDQVVRKLIIQRN